MDIELEKKTFQAFVVPSKRSRYAELLDSERGRKKVRLSLDHFKDLNPRFCQEPKPSDSVHAALSSFGAPSNCYVISSNDKLDGREMNLGEALKEIVGFGFGSFISCIPGKLAYFEGEGPSDRFICRRTT